MTRLPLRALLVSATAVTLLAGSIAAFGQSSNDGSPGFLGGLFGGNLMRHRLTATVHRSRDPRSPRPIPAI